MYLWWPLFCFSVLQLFLFEISLGVPIYVRPSTYMRASFKFLGFILWKYTYLSLSYRARVISWILFQDKVKFPQFQKKLSHSFAQFNHEDASRVIRIWNFLNTFRDKLNLQFDKAISFTALCDALMEIDKYSTFASENNSQHQEYNGKWVDMSKKLCTSLWMLRLSSLTSCQNELLPLPLKICLSFFFVNLSVSNRSLLRKFKQQFKGWKLNKI